MNSIQSTYYIKVAETDYELQNCYRLRHKVYCQEKKWLPAAAYPDELETDEFDAKAIHVMAMDDDFNTVGYIRILRDSNYPQLPCVSHPSLKGKNLEFPGLAELSRFIITPGRDGLYIARQMLKVVWQTSISQNIGNWIIICEPSLIRLIVKFKYYFEPIAAPVMYYGGLTQPAVLNAESTLDRWVRSDREALEFYHKDIVVSAMKQKVRKASTHLA
jgi:N-acyl-L-homoserine lactone synthetase